MKHNPDPLKLVAGAWRRSAVAIATGALLIVAAGLAGCAAGNAMYTESAAGFWAGLWHGLILVFAFVISLFSDGVRVYEPMNSGALYNLGFVLGAAIFFGGSGSKRVHRSVRRKREGEWEQFCAQAGEEIRKGIKTSLAESGQGDEEWEELGRKIEEKIKRELRKWAEK